MSHIFYAKSVGRRPETHKYTHHPKNIYFCSLLAESVERVKHYHHLRTWCFNRTHISFNLSRKGNRLLLGLPGMLHRTKGKVGRDWNLTRDTVQTLNETGIRFSHKSPELCVLWFAAPVQHRKSFSSVLEVTPGSLATQLTNSLKITWWNWVW